MGFGLVDISRIALSPLGYRLLHPDGAEGPLGYRLLHPDGAEGPLGYRLLHPDGAEGPLGYRLLHPDGAEGPAQDTDYCIQTGPKASQEVPTIASRRGRRPSLGVPTIASRRGRRPSQEYRHRGTVLPPPSVLCHSRFTLSTCVRFSHASHRYLLFNVRPKAELV